jgi:hypothetical protein
MDRRFELHSILQGILGSVNVYFQPPESVKLVYPCIIYSRGVIGRTEFANDKPYRHQVRYSVTVIDKNPDSPILDKMADLPMCAFERHYTADNLNHDVYNLYY